VTLTILITGGEKLIIDENIALGYDPAPIG
jgi:hypothetical protein